MDRNGQSTHRYRMLITPKQQRALTLRLRRGKSFKQIGIELGINESSAAKLVRRARSRLQKFGLHPDRLTPDDIRDFIAFSGIR